MKKIILIVYLFLGVFVIGQAQENQDIFTIYLVRHAEKGISTDNPGNPPLSDCGQLRAENLAIIFNDINIKRLYSTDYIRTLETAKPTAIAQNIEIELFNPQKLKDFSLLLLSRQEDVLVIGHSNTTGILAGMLVGEEIKPFDDAIYDRIYQVVIFKGRGRIHILNQSFICSN